ncbi:hypothetical protein QTO34_003078, partial [Cnephaeus nilssonii]
MMRYIRTVTRFCADYRFLRRGLTAAPMEAGKERKAWLLAKIRKKEGEKERAQVFHQQQFSSGHPPIRAPPASMIGHPERNSDREALRSPGGQRKTAAGGKLVPAATQSSTPSSATSVFRRPHGSFRSTCRLGRREELGSGTCESRPPAPTASQSATLSPALRASSRPNHGRSG